MKQVTEDAYLMCFKLTKNNMLSCAFSLCMVALLNCFILHGLALLLDGYLPQDRVKLLFSVKYFGLVFLAMLLIGIVLNLKISRLATKQTRKPHYPRIIVFMLISLSLLAYSGLVEMIG